MANPSKKRPWVLEVRFLNMESLSKDHWYAVDAFQDPILATAHLVTAKTRPNPSVVTEWRLRNATTGEITP